LNSSPYLRAILLFFTVVLILLWVPVSAKSGEAQGTQAAELLDQIKRAQALFKEIESYYKRVLQETPGAIPGWMLEPGDVRRSIQDTVALHLHTAELFSVEELLSCCSLSVPALERAWVEKNGIPANRAKEEFKKFLGPLLIEKRTASSLRKAAQ
jgi:hypothetical protein